MFAVLASALVMHTPVTFHSGSLQRPAGFPPACQNSIHPQLPRGVSTQGGGGGGEGEGGGEGGGGDHLTIPWLAVTADGGGGGEGREVADR